MRFRQVRSRYGADIRKRGVAVGRGRREVQAWASESESVEELLWSAVESWPMKIKVCKGKAASRSVVFPWGR